MTLPSVVVQVISVFPGMSAVTVYFSAVNPLLLLLLLLQIKRIKQSMLNGNTLQSSLFSLDNFLCVQCVSRTDYACEVGVLRPVNQCGYIRANVFSVKLVCT